MMMMITMTTMTMTMMMTMMMIDVNKVQKLSTGPHKFVSPSLFEFYKQLYVISTETILRHAGRLSQSGVVQWLCCWISLHRRLRDRLRHRPTETKSNRQSPDSVTHSRIKTPTTNTTKSKSIYLIKVWTHRSQKTLTHAQQKKIGEQWHAGLCKLHTHKGGKVIRHALF